MKIDWLDSLPIVGVKSVAGGKRGVAGSCTGVGLGLALRLGPRWHASEQGSWTVFIRCYAILTAASWPVSRTVGPARPWWAGPPAAPSAGRWHGAPWARCRGQRVRHRCSRPAAQHRHAHRPRIVSAGGQETPIRRALERACSGRARKIARPGCSLGIGFRSRWRPLIAAGGHCWKQPR